MTEDAADAAAVADWRARRAAGEEPEPWDPADNLEDAYLARATRAALAEDGDPIPWEQVKAEAGI